MSSAGADTVNAELVWLVWASQPQARGGAVRCGANGPCPGYNSAHAEAGGRGNDPSCREARQTVPRPIPCR